MTQVVYGLVENIEYAPLRIQATLPDMDGMLSPWALVLCSRSQTAKSYDPPVKGEQVAILMYDDGESALCLGSVMSDVDNSPADGHQYTKVFDDGTRIDYDPNTSVLSINAVGAINVVCAGDVTVTANHAAINNDVTINGKATITDDAVIGGISFINHKHGGVRSGGSKTQPPS
ncbi:phage baseplate assembly protein V [Psychrobacter lutiphocae]|uniref:phage baseplate assembly protein V n=1 Tax=Psychrobacter lutiphocae TaxID=540500 RepID=UPI00036CC1B3|nr:phage baseplate assembly protein V [Psychrobacter lutiphocae]